MARWTGRMGLGPSVRAASLMRPGRSRVGLTAFGRRDAGDGSGRREREGAEYGTGRLRRPRSCLALGPATSLTRRHGDTRRPRSWLRNAKLAKKHGTPSSRPSRASRSRCERIPRDLPRVRATKVACRGRRRRPVPFSPAPAPAPAPAPVIRHPSPVTRHPSPVTRRPSPGARHAPPSARRPLRCRTASPYERRGAPPHRRRIDEAARIGNALPVVHPRHATSGRLRTWLETHEDDGPRRRKCHRQQRGTLPPWRQRGRDRGDDERRAAQACATGRAARPEAVERQPVRDGRVS